MAITVNGKIIRSIPEQVARNSRRIDEIEAQKSLYLYVVVYGDSDGSCFSFQFISNKGDYEFEDDYEALVEALKDNRTIHLPASGYCDSLAEQIFMVNVVSDTDIVIETVAGNQHTFAIEDVDGIACFVVKIL